MDVYPLIVPVLGRDLKKAAKQIHVLSSGMIIFNT